MRSPSTLQIQPYRAGIGWPHAVCPRRGDLGCLAAHAKAAGYRADDLAMRLGVGERALRLCFRNSIGIPLKKWLGDMRRLEVRRRLLGDESIQEIAFSVGFSHAKELAREFRKVYQVTPSDFRSRERNRAQATKP